MLRLPFTSRADYRSWPRTTDSMIPVISTILSHIVYLVLEKEEELLAPPQSVELLQLHQAFFLVMKDVSQSVNDGRGATPFAA